VSHVRSCVHEWSGHLLFDAHADRPYWALRRIYSHEIGGGAKSIPVEIDGEEWSGSLSFQKSGLEPRVDDDVDQLYEYRVNANGEEHRKIRLLIQPRLGWEDDDRRPGGLPASLGEAVNVRVDIAVNVEPDDIRRLVPLLLKKTFDELGVRWSSDFFAGPLHEYSTITRSVIDISVPISMVITPVGARAPSAIAKAPAVDTKSPVLYRFECRFRATPR
jgi:hypothetical protein